MTSHHAKITSKCQNSRHLGSAILDFEIFPKRPKTAKNHCKVLKINKTVLKIRKMVKVIALKLISINRNTKFTNFCENMPVKMPLPW